MAIYLVASQCRILEAVADARPAIEQPACPGEANQAKPDLDAACPMHAGEEGIGPPPGLQMLRGQLSIGLPRA